MKARRAAADEVTGEPTFVKSWGGKQNQREPTNSQELDEVQESVTIE